MRASERYCLATPFFGGKVDAMEGGSNEKKDRSGRLLEVGSRVRNTKAEGFSKLGNVVALEVDGKPDSISVEWDKGKKKFSIKASSVEIISEEKEREVKEFGDKGKKASNAGRDWSGCTLLPEQIALLQRAGVTEHAWKLYEKEEAKSQLQEYGLSFGQLKRWVRPRGV